MLSLDDSWKIYMNFRLQTCLRNTVFRGDHSVEETNARVHARDRGTTGGRVDKRKGHESNPRHILIEDKITEPPITSVREVLRLKKFRRGARVHARDSRSPAQSGSNPLTAGVAPFPPATTRQPLTRRLFPGPRAVDLPSPTRPTTQRQHQQPYYHHLHRHLRETAALPATMSITRVKLTTAEPFARKIFRLFVSLFIPLFSFLLYFRKISKSCEYRFPMSPYGTKIEGLPVKSHISNLRKLRNGYVRTNSFRITMR